MGRPWTCVEDALAQARAGQPMYYRAADGGLYVFVAAAGLQPGPARDLLLTAGLRLVLTQEDALQLAPSSGSDMACSMTVEGLQALLVPALASGPDLLPKVILDGRTLLTDERVEARALEFLWHSGSRGPVLMGRLHSKVSASKDLLDADAVLQARYANRRLLHLAGRTPVRLKQGDFELYSYYSEIDRRYHWAFVRQGLETGQRPLVRIESECLTGHVFGSQLCDCGAQLAEGLAKIAAHGHGALIYLRQEGRGIGLKAKLQAYYLQQVHGLDTVEANLAVGMPDEARDYVIGAQILRDLAWMELDLLTNNPAKVEGLSRYGLQVGVQHGHVITAGPFNERYLSTKRDKMGHLLPGKGLDQP